MTMKRPVRLLLPLVLMLTLTSVAAADHLNASLEDVVLLSQKQLSSATILAFLDARDLSFELDAESIAWLREQGVSEEVIRYLLERMGAGSLTPNVPVSRDAYYVYPQRYYSAGYLYDPGYYAGYYGFGSYLLGSSLHHWWGGYPHSYYTHGGYSHGGGHSYGGHGVSHRPTGTHSAGSHVVAGSHGLDAGGHTGTTDQHRATGANHLGTGRHSGGHLTGGATASGHSASGHATGSHRRAVARSTGASSGHSGSSSRSHSAGGHTGRSHSGGSHSRGGHSGSGHSR